MNPTIYRLEFKLFFRNKAALSGILILLISGFAGLYFGKKFIRQQDLVIEKAGRMQQEQTSTNIKHFGKDPGLLLYHNKFSMVNVPDRWAAFANGQRDINPYLLPVTMLAVEGQIYDTDLSNPSTLLLGNMDLAFVFIFLFPLVIIAFTYSLLSSDQESGVWAVLKSQSGNLLRLIWRKFSIRVFSIFAVALVLMISALFYLQLPADLRFLVVLLLLSLYLLFWFSLSFWVISLGRSSNYNAVLLISFWVVLNIIAPAMLNVWLTQQYPVPEALETLVKQREGYHEKWDIDKSKTMDKFYQHYPQFKQYPFPAELSFSWYWYYAMQQMGDDEALPGAMSMSEKLIKRHHFTNLSSLFLPGIQTQLRLNELAGSDLENHLNFQKAVKAYHEKIRLYFYPLIFQNKTIAKVQWDKFKVAPYTGHTTGNVWQHLLSVGILVLLFTTLAIYNFRKRISLF
ncbi:ABC-2 type transport system permease protein [Pedobacter steynii]|uniref:ABC-2 type transport system permease protein n=1 Tax=Pedobacter steynii TaxID=430522 RepID=A0A1G9NR68_9SPHI|nr:DUF3526 domain-containing protein [Pedobacter steynii]NQX39227.1 DUF3526 domain-containing protein [Pedobacter steynii]SDL88537.1 ABC-2 type transport system permease protein [Pedobacter steynii]